MDWFALPMLSTTRFRNCTQVIRGEQSLSVSCGLPSAGVVGGLFRIGAVVVAWTGALFYGADSIRVSFGSRIAAESELKWSIIRRDWGYAVARRP